MRNCVKDYLENGIIDDRDFLWFLMTNDFLGMCKVADAMNQRMLFEWAMFVYQEVPIDAHGSSSKVNAWCRARQADANTV